MVSPDPAWADFTRQYVAYWRTMARSFARAAQAINITSVIEYPPGRDPREPW